MVTYSNATFELYRQNEDTKEWEQVECKVGDKYYKSWTTNSEGIAKTETKLEAGNYKLSEVKIPTGFIQLDGELTFRVDNRNSTLNYDKDFDAWITVTAKNEQPTGTLKLNKKVVLREDMDKTIIKDIDFTKISFELVAKENVIDYADGSIIYKKGKVVGKYNLKSDGTLTVNNVPMGKYYLKELTTIDGAVLDETEHELVRETRTQWCTKTHDSLKISNGYWNWCSVGIGGKNAVDYMEKVQNIPYPLSAKIVADRMNMKTPVIIETQKKSTETHLILPEKITMRIEQNNI